MKKCLLLFLCFLILSSNVVYATSADSAETAETILTDYYHQHKDELYPQNAIKDIEEAMLADIDNDGIPELLFSRYSYFYGLTVYKVKDGNVVEIPDKIWFGSGTGIRENISFLMDQDGQLYIYREGIHALVPSEGRNTVQVIYEWSENALTPVKCLGMSIFYNNPVRQAKFTTKYDEGSYFDISSEEADAKFEEFKNQVAPYMVWSQEDTDKNSGLNRIWNQQKEKYANNTTIGADTSIVLQIGNPMMNVNGFIKAVDEGTETAPIEQNGRTLVPIRAIVEEMGGTVEWDDTNNMAILSYSGKTIKLVIDSNIAYLDDVAETLDVAPVVINDRTMLPIRFIAEGFGFTVTWKELTQQIMITKRAAK